MSIIPKEITRFSASIPLKLLEEFDKTASKLSYTRSKGIELAMRNFLTEYPQIQETTKLAGAITMVYEHSSKNLNRVLTKIQHQFREVISSTSHIHLDEASCLEIIAVKGEAKSIQYLSNKLMAVKGVKQLRIAKLVI